MFVGDSVILYRFAVAYRWDEVRWQGQRTPSTREGHEPISKMVRYFHHHSDKEDGGSQKMEHDTRDSTSPRDIDCHDCTLKSPMLHRIRLR